MDGDILDAYNQTKLTGVSMTITARTNNDNNHFVARVMEKEAQVLTPKRTEFGKAVRKAYEGGELDMSRHDMTELEPRGDGISNTLTSVQKDNIVEQTEAITGEERARIESEGWEWNQERGTYTRLRFRKFTPRECFRLMDVTESDIDRIQATGISEYQQYKMAGNSIVVACLEGIFRNLFFPPENKETLF